MRNEFLFNSKTFFKKKYDNWQEALIWANEYALDRPGEVPKLQGLLAEKKDYEYRCKDEPLHSYCHAAACRRMPFGVGSNSGHAFMHDITLTMQKGKPVKYFLEGLSVRVELSARELESFTAFRVRLREYGINPGNLIKKQFEEWRDRAMENMEIIEPPRFLQANANFRRALASFFDGHIPRWARNKGQEFLTGKCGDYVRVEKDIGRIYFKLDQLYKFCVKALNFTLKDANELEQYLFEINAEHLSRTCSRGGWWRGTWSISFSEFEDWQLEKWFDPEKKNEQSMDVAADESSIAR
jgi:hypothetical protein